MLEGHVNAQCESGRNTGAVKEDSIMLGPGIEGLESEMYTSIGYLFTFLSIPFFACLVCVH